MSKLALTVLCTILVSNVWGAESNVTEDVVIEEEVMEERMEVEAPKKVQVGDYWYILEEYGVQDERLLINDADGQGLMLSKPEGDDRQAVAVRRSADNGGTEIAIDPIKAYAMDGKMTWQEGFTYFGGALGAIVGIGAATDWYGLDGSDGGGHPAGQTGGNTLVVQGDGNQVNFQGSGSGGSGQQSGSESLSGANAGNGTGGN